MSEMIAPEVFLALMRESFDRGQDIVFTPSGTSMLPMLDGKDDKVTFSPKPEQLKKYDVVFYQRPRSGQLVLHRLIGFDRNGGYVFCGDNQYDYEYGIEDKDVLALMTSFTRHGKQHSVDDASYRLYIWRMMLKKRIHRFLGRIYRRIFKRKK